MTYRQTPRKPKHWAAEAPDIAALISSMPWATDAVMAAVNQTLDYLIAHFESVEPELELITHDDGFVERFINPPGDPQRPDLKNPDFGIPYCLYFKDVYQGRDLTALHLFQRCLHIVERGNLTDKDRICFPLDFQAMAGLEAESQQRKAKKLGRRRSKTVFEIDLIEKRKNHPDDTLDELLTRLEGDDRVMPGWHTEDVEGGVVFWLDEDGTEKITPRKTVRRWFTKARKILT